ncbi:MAG TPA: hypothetical protein DEA08_09445 [Planctomycetes bacterium]|nr:hypothetical protein [Planctomycetota bacterium]
MQLQAQVTDLLLALEDPSQDPVGAFASVVAAVVIVATSIAVGVVGAAVMVMGGLASLLGRATRHGYQQGE